MSAARLQLRCERHLHLVFDPERGVVSVKCAQCTKDQQRPVYHDWPLPEIVERWKAGDVSGVCHPSQPEFVHWRVAAA